MMSFDEYNDYLENWEKENKQITRRIAYRQIQLVGRKCDSFSVFSVGLMGGICQISDEERRTLDSDEILLSLNKIKEQNDAEMQYVLKYGRHSLDYDTCKALVDTFEEEE